MKKALVFASLFLSALASLAPLASALSWCSDSGGLTQVTSRGTTKSTNVFEEYDECDYAAGESVGTLKGIYSCEDYCADESTLAKFYCSLHQPGSERLAMRTYVDCVKQGYAGCSNGACVARMPAAPSPSPTPSPKPAAWCKPAQALSAAAPLQIIGARADGSTFAFTDYCSGGRTLMHYSCADGYYKTEFRECAGECAGGACVPAAVVKPPGRESGVSAWAAYGVIGVFIVACGVALWLYFPGKKSSSKSKKRGGR